jgi:RimJ/RimL family protein N-acetyltransferase
MIPLLQTNRLLLRPFRSEDQSALLLLISEKEVAATTLRIPHPCTLRDVQDWLATHGQEYERRETIRWAVCLRHSDTLVGGISLFLNDPFQSAELGYWIGRPYWGQGCAWEAAKKVVDFGFDVVGLNRIEAHFMLENGASAKILEKLGMQYEGLHRQLIKRWGQFKDVKTYAMLQSDRSTKAVGG